MSLATMVSCWENVKEGRNNYTDRQITFTESIGVYCMITINAKLLNASVENKARWRYCRTAAAVRDLIWDQLVLFCHSVWSQEDVGVWLHCCTEKHAEQEDTEVKSHLIWCSVSRWVEFELREEMFMIDFMITAHAVNRTLHHALVVYDSICRNDSNACVARPPEQNVPAHPLLSSCIMYLISARHIYATQCMHDVYMSSRVHARHCMHDYWLLTFVAGLCQNALHTLWKQWNFSQTLKTHVGLSANQNDTSIHPPMHVTQPIIWSGFGLPGCRNLLTHTQRAAEPVLLQAVKVCVIMPTVR